MYTQDLIKLVREGYKLFERFIAAHERIANACDRMYPQYSWTGVVPTLPPVHIPANEIPQPYRPLIGDPGTSPSASVSFASSRTTSGTSQTSRGTR
jgi:hypothetical protein